MMNNGTSDSNIGNKNGGCGNAYLSPLAVIALSFGYAVGWGAFVLPGTMFLPNAGPAGTIIGFLIGTVAIAGGHGRAYRKAAESGRTFERAQTIRHVTYSRTNGLRTGGLRSPSVRLSRE